MFSMNIEMISVILNVNFEMLTPKCAIFMIIGLFIMQGLRIQLSDIIPLSKQGKSTAKNRGAYELPTQKPTSHSGATWGKKVRIISHTSMVTKEATFFVSILHRNSQGHYPYPAVTISFILRSPVFLSLVETVCHSFNIQDQGIPSYSKNLSKFPCKTG